LLELEQLAGTGEELTERERERGCAVGRRKMGVRMCVGRNEWMRCVRALG
jgi:hypothetical protein